MGKDPFIDDLPFDMVIFHSLIFHYTRWYVFQCFPCSAIVILWCSTFFRRFSAREISTLFAASYGSQPVAAPCCALQAAGLFPRHQNHMKMNLICCNIAMSACERGLEHIGTVDAIHLCRGARNWRVSGCHKNDTLLGHIDHIYLYLYMI